MLLEIQQEKAQRVSHELEEVFDDPSLKLLPTSNHMRLASNQTERHTWNLRPLMLSSLSSKKKSSGLSGISHIVPGLPRGSVVGGLE